MDKTYYGFEEDEDIDMQKYFDYWTGFKEIPSGACDPDSENYEPEADQASWDRMRGREDFGLDDDDDDW